MALIQITDLTFAYPGSFDNVFEHVSFQFDTDWRLGLTGRNGRGKTTLLRLPAGAVSPSGHDHGSRRVRVFPVSGSGRIAYAAGTAGAQLSDVPEWRFRRNWLRSRSQRTHCTARFPRFPAANRQSFAGAAVRAGGPVFAHRRANESSGRDGPRALVSRYLAKKSGFLLVSHDRAFLDGCVDHILSIGRSSIEVQRGNFSSWYENKQRQDAFELAQNAQLKKKSAV